MLSTLNEDYYSVGHMGPVATYYLKIKKSFGL